MRALHRRDVIRHGIIGLLLSLLLPASVSAGQAYYILDARTGKALAAHNADVRNHPASLTKKITLYLKFKALHRERIKWSSRVAISRHAASMSPTKLWVKAGSSITVREAVLGMIVPSANDAASAMAEKLAVTIATVLVLLIGQTGLFPWVCRPPLVANLFPNIDGKWKGSLDSNWPEIAKRAKIPTPDTASKPVAASLTIRARLFFVHITLVSDSNYSTSKTIFVRATKHPENGELKLSYV